MKKISSVFINMETQLLCHLMETNKNTSIFKMKIHKKRNRVELRLHNKRLIDVISYIIVKAKITT